MEVENTPVAPKEISVLNLEKCLGEGPKNPQRDLVNALDLYSPDACCKRFFEGMSVSVIGGIVDYISGRVISNPDSELEYLSTESQSILGGYFKSSIRADSTLFFRGKEEHLMDVVSVEFQSTVDKTMARREFFYTLNAAAKVHKVHQSLFQGSPHQIPALGITIYLTPDKAEAEGVDSATIDYSHNGCIYNDETKTKTAFDNNGPGRVILLEYRVVNLAQLEVDAILDCPLRYMLPLSAHQFLPHSEKLLQEEGWEHFYRIAVETHRLVAELDEQGRGSEAIIVGEILTTITAAIYKKVKTKKEYKKVVMKMEATMPNLFKETVSYYEAKGEARGEARGEAKGEARGKAKTLAELIQRNLNQGRSKESILEIFGCSEAEFNDALAYQQD